MRKLFLNLAIAVKVVLSVSQLAYGGERPASAPPIDVRLTGIEQKNTSQDAEIAELSRKIDALKLAIRCPCPRGGECICPAGECLCPNCPKHSKAKVDHNHGRSALDITTLRRHLISDHGFTSTEVYEMTDAKVKAAHGTLHGPEKKKATAVPSGLENQDDGIPFYGVSWKGTTPTNKGVELLFFTASWCPNCPAAIERLGERTKDIYVIDCSENGSEGDKLAAKYGVTAFPYLLRIEDGRFDEGRAGDAVHEVAARDWLNGRTLTAGAGANTVGGKPSAPAATSGDFIPKLIAKSSPQYSYSRTGYNPVQQCSVTRLGGSRWTWPGNLGSHLSSAHGFNPAGFSHSQLVTIHDNFHNTGRSGVVRSGGYTSSAPYRTWSQPASYQFQPRVQFTSGYSYGTCPNCPR